MFFKFLNFFAIFLEFSITGLVGNYWNDFSFSLSRPFQTYIGLKESIMVFFNFLIFLLFFLEFSITGRVRTHRNDFFYFLSILAFPNLFWPEKLPKWWFLVFLIFFAIFWNFLLRVE